MVIRTSALREFLFVFSHLPEASGTFSSVGGAAGGGTGPGALSQPTRFPPGLVISPPLRWLSAARAVGVVIVVIRRTEILINDIVPQDPNGKFSCRPFRQVEGDAGCGHRGNPNESDPRADN